MKMHLRTTVPADTAARVNKLLGAIPGSERNALVREALSRGLQSIEREVPQARREKR